LGGCNTDVIDINRENVSSLYCRMAA